VPPLVVLSLGSAVTGQTFERSYGGPARERSCGMVTYPDGGFLLAGSIEQLPGLAGLLLVRTDSRGDTLWTKVIADSGIDKRVNSAIDDGSGGLIAVGKARSQRADWDACVIRVDSTGTVIWSQTWGVSGWDDCVLAACRTWDGGWAVCGYTLQRRQPDVLASRFTSDGTRTWSSITGTAQADYGYSIATATDSTLVIAGTTVPAGSRYTDVYLLRLDHLGQLRWSLTLGDSLWDEARAVTTTPDGGLAVAGFSSSYGIGMDCYAARLDSAGQTLWFKAVGRPYRSDRTYALVSAADGSLVLAGASETAGGGETDAYMVRIGPQGALDWERLHGRTGSDCAFAIKLLGDGGMAVVGETETDSCNGIDFYLLRTDSAGAVGIRADEPPAESWKSALATPASTSAGAASFCLTRVFAPDGRIVRTLHRDEAVWDGRDAKGVEVGSGVFCIIRSDGHIRRVVRFR